MKKYAWTMLLIGLVACSSGDYNGEEEIIVSPYYISAPNELRVSADEEKVDLKVQANCAWTVSASASWITIATSSGENEQTVVVAVEKNPGNSERTAQLEIRNASIPVRKVTIVQSKPTDSSQIPGGNDNLPPS